MSFDTVSLDDLGDEVASAEVRASGINVRTLPEGKYTVEVESMELRRIPADSSYNPGRLTANYKLKNEEGRWIFMDVSWEPNDKGETDSANKLYSQLEVALNMPGEAIRQVLEASEGATFVVDVIESCRVAVGDLPEDKQAYYTDTKGLGEMSPVTFYIKADDEDSRMFLYANGHKVRNYIRTLSAA